MEDIILPDLDDRVESKGGTIYEEDSALRIGVCYGYSEIVEMLLSAGASPIEQDHEGKTPLEIAAGRVGVTLNTLRQLYEATMNHPQKPEGVEVKALYNAAWFKQIDKVGAMLEFGAQDRPVAGSGVERPVMRAAIGTEHVDLVERLLQEDRNYQPRRKMLPVIIAEAEDHLAELESKSTRKSQPWFVARKSDAQSVKKVLVKAMHDENIRRTT